jgi:2,5-diketo-D-gluconate reductase B
MINKVTQNTSVPAIGMGTLRLSDQDCPRSFFQAPELGYCYIDTARMYNNEEKIGEALQQSGVPRSELFLTSKIWSDDLTPLGVFSNTEQSLRLLRTDYLDLLLIHWPNPTFPLEKTLAAMQELQQQGKIRHLGVSNFPPSLCRRACELAPVFCNQVEYHPWLNQDRLLALAREKDLLLTAYAPLTQGGIFTELVLQDLSRKYNKTSGQIALRWLIQQDQVAAIPKAAKRGHQQVNLDIFDFELSPEDMARIDALPKNKRLVNPAEAPDLENQ